MAEVSSLVIIAAASVLSQSVLSVCLSLHMSVCLSLCLSVCLSLSVSVSACLSQSMSVSVCVCLTLTSDSMIYFGVLTCADLNMLQRATVDPLNYLAGH